MTTIRQVQALVADRYGATVVALLGQGRRQKIVLPRHIAMFLAYEMMSRPSLLTLAREFRRDHSTVLYGINRIEHQLRTDSALFREIETLRTILAWREAA